MHSGRLRWRGDVCVQKVDEIRFDTTNSGINHCDVVVSAGKCHKGHRGREPGLIKASLHLLYSMGETLVLALLSCTSGMSLS